MEDRKLTPQESMELIGSMIAATRRRISLQMSNNFVTWGVAVTAISGVIAILMYFKFSPAWNWLWTLVVPLSIYTNIKGRKNACTEPLSFTDRLSVNIWNAAMAIAILGILSCLAMSAIYHTAAVWTSMYYYPFFVIGMSAMAQGIVVRERTMVAGGLAGVCIGGTLGSLMMAGVEFDLYIYYICQCFALMAMILIPSIVMRAKAKRQLR